MRNSSEGWARVFVRRQSGILVRNHKKNLKDEVLSEQGSTPIRPGDYEPVRLHLQTLFDAAIVMAQKRIRESPSLSVAAGIDVTKPIKSFLGPCRIKTLLDK